MDSIKKEHKNSIKVLDAHSEDESEEEDISRVSEILKVPKILGHLNGLFSYYGRIKWIIFDKESTFSEKSKKKLKGLGWKHIMKDIYESPIILSFEIHLYLKKRLNPFRKT
jgi:hypothetical protein